MPGKVQLQKQVAAQGKDVKSCKQKTSPGGTYKAQRRQPACKLNDGGAEHPRRPQVVRPTDLLVPCWIVGDVEAARPEP